MQCLGTCTCPCVRAQLGLLPSSNQVLFYPVYDYESVDPSDEFGTFRPFMPRLFRMETRTYIIMPRLLQLISLAIDRLNRSSVAPPEVPQVVTDLSTVFRRFPEMYRLARQYDMWRFDMELTYLDWSKRTKWRGPPFLRDKPEETDVATLLGAQAFAKRPIDAGIGLSPSGGACSLITEDCTNGYRQPRQSVLLLRNAPSHANQPEQFQVLWEEPLNNSVVANASWVSVLIQRSAMQSSPADSRHIGTFTIGSYTEPIKTWDALEDIVPPGHSLRISIPLDQMAAGRQFASVTIADEVSMLIHHGYHGMPLDGVRPLPSGIPSVYKSTITFMIQSRKVVGHLNSPMHNESYSLATLPIHLSVTGLLSTDVLAILIDGYIVDIDSLATFQLSESGVRTLHSAVNLAEYINGSHIFRVEVFDSASQLIWAKQISFLKEPASAAKHSSSNRIIGDLGDTFRFDGTCLTSGLQLLYFSGGDVMYDFPPLAPDESLSVEASCTESRQWAPVVVGQNLLPSSRPAWPSPRTLVMMRPSSWQHGRSEGRLILSDLFGLFSVMRDLHEPVVDVLLLDIFQGGAKLAPGKAEQSALFHAAGGDVWLFSEIWQDYRMEATRFEALGWSGELICPKTLVTGFSGRGLDCADQVGRAAAAPDLVAEMRARLHWVWNFSTAGFDQHAPSSAAPLLLVELQLPCSVVIEEPGWEEIAQIANEAQSKEPIRLARIDGTRLTFVQRLAAISGANLFVAHTGAPALGGAVMMASGSIVIELLRYVGRNSSVSIGAGTAWTAMPEILRIPFEFFDDDALPSSPNCIFPHPGRLQAVRISSARFLRTLASSVTLWSDWRRPKDSTLPEVLGNSLPGYNRTQLDRTCEFLARSTDVSPIRWLCSHSSIEIWDDVTSRKDCKHDDESEPPSFLAHSL